MIWSEDVAHQLVLKSQISGVNIIVDIAPKLARRLVNNAAEMPVEIQSDWITLNTYVSAFLRR